MPKLMKPITFGCDNGFQETYYDSEAPIDEKNHQAGAVYCYLGRLTDEEKKNRDCLKKCLSMKPGECWKV